MAQQVINREVVLAQARRDLEELEAAIAMQEKCMALLEEATAQKEGESSMVWLARMVASLVLTRASEFSHQHAQNVKRARYIKDGLSREESLVKQPSSVVVPRMGRG
jgi:hypothetical protein